MPSFLTGLEQYQIGRVYPGANPATAIATAAVYVVYVIARVYVRAVTRVIIESAQSNQMSRLLY